MKALLKNLIIAGALSLFAVQAQAADPATVIWTFSGLDFTAVADSSLNPTGPATGAVTGTMSFDSSHNLIDFNIATTGTPFSFTYTSATAIAYAPNDSSNDFPGSWTFEAVAGGNYYDLVVTFVGVNADPSIWPAGAGPIADILIDPTSTFEIFASNENPDGTIRIPDSNSSPYIYATRVPEPASMALLGTGLLGLGAAVRRRSRTNS